MPTFNGTDFEIELPHNVRDESTYAFVFPARASFRPSVVVKTDRLTAPTELPAYVDTQLQSITTMLPNVVLVSTAPARHRDLPAHTAVYDFGEDDKRVRQKQRYILIPEPLRVVTLTATCLTATFAETDDLFEAVFGSFTPVASSVSGA